MLKMLTEKTLVNDTCTYLLKVRRSNHDKYLYYEQLLTCITSAEDFEISIIDGDLNGHFGKESVTIGTYHGGKGYGKKNPERLTISDLCSQTDLSVSNTIFKKKQNK